jgi:hypothetical protein
VFVGHILYTLQVQAVAVEAAVGTYDLTHEVDRMKKHHQGQVHPDAYQTVLLNLLFHRHQEVLQHHLSEIFH